MKFPPINLWSAPKKIGYYMTNHIWDWGDEVEDDKKSDESFKAISKLCFGKYQKGYPCITCELQNACIEVVQKKKDAITERMKAMIEAKQQQVGGDHYKQLKIQPVEYIYANKLDFLQGNIIKYVTRFRNKNGKVDLEKARHCIDLLIELEYANK
jgi:hypothetical protein